MVRMKRVYEPAEAEDGYRVLAERLWPRGLSKDKARLDTWEKDIAPSADLRRWYGHDPAKWDEFQTRYEKELAAPEAQAILADLAERARRQTVTLLYASHAAAISNTAVLLRLLTQHPTAHGSEN
ncbi:MAG: DUF488 domain-containing protein [Chloroflexota bacterium]